jgi:hypothetical protein
VVALVAASKVILFLFRSIKSGAKYFVQEAGGVGNVVDAIKIK